MHGTTCSAKKSIRKPPNTSLLWKAYNTPLETEEFQTARPWAGYQHQVRAAKAVEKQPSQAGTRNLGEAEFFPSALQKSPGGHSKTLARKRSWRDSLQVWEVHRCTQAADCGSPTAIGACCILSEGLVSCDGISVPCFSVP